MSTEPLAAGTAIDAQNPWPGLSAFDEAAERFFNGRDAESAEMVRLVGQAPLTVLFGKSGLGKTSLVQAGLFPRLRQQNIFPVYVRLDVRDHSAPLIEQAATALRGEIGKHGVDAPAPNPGESLWEHLHGRHVAWWSRRNQSLAPLFVFDQFEEVFTLGAENSEGIERLRLDLADLIENRIPSALAQHIEGGASAEHLDLRGQRYKVLLSFREDFLPEVEGWKGQLPSVMRNRLRLLPMSADRALQVVSGKTPAGTTHALVSNETAREIVRFVAAVQTGDEKTGRGKGMRKAADPTWETLEIEPALLSLVCEGLNDKRKARAQATIDAALLKETGEAIIGDFYQRCVAEVPDKTRRFIEDALITEGGFRNSYPLQDALEQGVLTEPLLRQLVDRRLLRIDHQLGADRVELIHDRLTDVVREHRDKERERIRARRQRRMWWATGSVVVVLLVIAGLLFSLWQSAQEAKIAAERALIRADREAAIAQAAKTHADEQAELAQEQKMRALEATATALKSLEDAKQAQKKEALAAATAKRAANAATAALRETTAGKLAMHSRAIVDQKLETIDMALLLAAASYRLSPRHEASGGLQYALLATPGVVKVVGLSDPVIAISPDNAMAITLGRDDTLRVWDVGIGRPRGVPLPHERGTESVGPTAAFSPDGKIVVSGSGDRTLRLWDVMTGRPRGAFLQKDADWAGTPAFSPDGKTLVFQQFGGGRRALRLLDSLTGEPRGIPMPAHTDIVPVAFSPDGKTVVSGSRDATLRLWDVETGQPRGEPMKGHTKGVFTVAFSPDGKTLASGSLDATLRLWDVATGQPRSVPMQGHTNFVLAVAFSKDGKTLVSGSYDNTLRLWDVATGKPRGAPLRGHTGAVRVVAFDGDGKTLVSASDDGTFRRWRMPTDQSPGTSLIGHTAGVTSVAFSPDGKTIASGSYDKTLRLWNVASGQPRRVPPQEAAHWVASVAFSPDGKTVVFGSTDGTLHLSDVATGRARGVIRDAHAGGVTEVAFSPDGGTLVSASVDDTLRLWDAATAQPRGAPITGHKGGVTSVAFSPDGRILASGAADWTVRLWNVGTGQPRGQPLQGHTGRVTGVSFSPDGKSLVSGSEDGTLRLWDVATGQPRGSPLRGHTSGVSSVAFSPDGNTIVSGSVDKTLRLWDAATGQARGAPLEGHTDGVDSVAFSHDGKRIVSGSRDRTLRLWDAPPVWIDRVCAKVVRNLNRAEWKQYVGDIPYVKQCPDLPVPPD